MALHTIQGLRIVVLLAAQQVIGTVYRSRYYFAWSMGHCSLALAGMDFLKWDTDPKTGAVKGVWGRCKNATPLKVEFQDSARLLAHYWNITTGNFLRRWGTSTKTAPACRLLLQLIRGLSAWRRVGQL